MSSRQIDESVVPRSVGRVLDLLETVLSATPTNLTGAAAANGLTPTTALRHLRALEHRGYVRRDGTGAYAVGPTMLRLTARLRHLDPLDGLIAAAQQHLDALAASTGESTYLAIGDGRAATYVAAAESTRAIRHVGWIGQEVTLEGTALGEAFRRPGRTATRTGAVEPDITAISRVVPVDAPVAVAISIIGPAHRFTPTECTAHGHALERTVELLARQTGIGQEVAS